MHVRIDKQVVILPFLPSNKRLRAICTEPGYR